MGFLRKLLGGGGRGADAEGMYFYVRSKLTGEVVRLRLHRFNDLSQRDDETGYYTRKVVVGQKSFNRIEIEFTFDKDRRFRSAEVSDGELVEAEDYEAYLAQAAGED